MKAHTGNFFFDEGEGDNSFWGIIDIVTLMLIFFIILYAQEREPIKKQTIAITPPPPAVRVMSDISQAAQRHLKNLLGNGFYISPANPNLTLVLEEQIAFSSGHDTLTTDTDPILDQIAGLLQEERGYDVVISGHTDDMPIHNESFRSNWHLSAARAVAVANAFIVRGIDPERITTQGFAQFRPLLPNSDSFSRRKNRRVEITLIKNRDGDHPHLSEETPLSSRGLPTPISDADKGEF